MARGGDRVTTADVARRAGLSKMTVSRVLNGHHYVREATREKVLAAVRDLGFTPNALARRFFTGKAQIVGLIMPVHHIFSSFYFRDLFEGVLRSIEDRGYDLMLHDSTSALSTPVQKSREWVKGRMTDGLLLVASMAHDEYAYELTREGIPVVVMGETPHASEVCRVGIANRRAAADAVGRLVRLGHRRIAILTYDGHHLESVERLRGCEDALKQAAGAMAVVGTAHYQRHEARTETVRLMTEHPETTAVFACNGEMALGALDGLRSLGLRVPEDASVVSFDDFADLQVCDPPLSTVRQDARKVGAAAAGLLVDLLSGKAVKKPAQILVETEFVERQSTAPPRGSAGRG